MLLQTIDYSKKEKAKTKSMEQNISYDDNQVYGNKIFHTTTTKSMEQNISYDDNQVYGT